MAGVAALGARAGFLTGCPVHTRAPPQTRIVAPLTIEAAHKKGAGSTKNGRDSKSKRRGVKVYGGQPVKAGGIIVRQLGTHVRPRAPDPPPPPPPPDVQILRLEPAYDSTRPWLRPQFHPGPGVGLGHDYTLYAQEPGIVVFKQTKYQNQVQNASPPRPLRPPGGGGGSHLPPPSQAVQCSAGVDPS